MVKHPHIWTNEELKPWVRMRDNYLCAFCKIDVRLVDAGNTGEDLGGCSVHHIIPKELGGEDNPKNCITICANCHKLLEKLIFPIKNLQRDEPTVMIALRKRVKEDLIKEGYRLY